MTQYKQLNTVTEKLVKQFTKTTNAHERKTKPNPIRFLFIYDIVGL